MVADIGTTNWLQMFRFVTCGQLTGLSGTLDAIQMLLHMQLTLTEHIGLTQLLGVRK
jgi:hypothetical protein